MNDSIPICRSILNHWIYNDAEYLKVWLTMLARARYTEEVKAGMHEGVMYTLNRGEFIFGRKKWSEQTGVGEQRLRTLIKKLEADSMIVNLSTTSKFTVYRIVNYEKFNRLAEQENKGLDDGCQPASNHQLTTIQPAANQQLTTNEECKEREEGSKKGVRRSTARSKKTPSESKVQFAEYVSLTNEEHSSLVAMIGEHGATRCIGILDDYKGASGKKYASDYRAIRNWVIDRYNEEVEKERKRWVAGRGTKTVNDFFARSGVNADCV